ncbi:MAG: hypothetical protein JO032_15130 [Alphaproteobacteria bacterium]|nr:hypothetical protein [Alphaproteobacteria bacterium]
MKLTEKVKFALDECRMLILGAQILLGFQLRAAFEDGFDRLPPHTQLLDAAGLGLMLCTVALLIAPGPYHRLVEAGDDSGGFHALATLYGGLALLPFSLGLGVDVFIATERIAGTPGALGAGAVAAVLALAFWYAMPELRKRTHGAKERSETMRQRHRREQTPLSQKIDQALTEGRVILPGAQALLGFQLAIVLTDGFEKLPGLSQAVHAASLGFVALSIVLLMAPAAYHRIVFAGEDSPDMYRIGSGFITWATVPLACGLSGDAYVVIAKIAGASTGIACAGAAALLLAALWYGLPLAARWRGQGRYEESAAE